MKTGIAIMGLLLALFPGWSQEENSIAAGPGSRLGDRFTALAKGHAAHVAFNLDHAMNSQQRVKHCPIGL